MLLSTSNQDEDALLSIQNRIKYTKRVLETKDIGSANFKKLLTSICKVLQSVSVGTQRLSALNNLAKALASMQKELKNYIKLASLALFYVLRDTPQLPSVFKREINGLRAPTNPKIKAAMETWAGSLLSMLLNSPAMIVLIPPVDADTDKQLIADDKLGNPFFGDSAKDLQVRLLVSKESGLLKYMQDDSEVVVKYIDLHGTLHELARGSLIFSYICHFLDRGTNDIE
jgi:hypothetical protein